MSQVFFQSSTSFELSSRWSLTSPEDLTGPMALRNPTPTRIAPLSPLNLEGFRDFKLPPISAFRRISEMSRYDLFTLKI